MNTRNILISGLIIVLIVIAATFLLTKGEKKQENKAGNAQVSTNMNITSTAFKQNEPIPSKYTCDGQDLTPPLSFSEVPGGAQSLALSVVDPDSPSGHFTHWVAWNIPADTKEIPEGSLSTGIIQGKNDFGKEEYGGPCPGQGTHRYVFNLYALDARLDIVKGASRDEQEDVMVNHILSHAELVGVYTRQK